MAVGDRHGLPVSVCVESATPHEVTLATSTLLQMVVPDAPQNLIGDNAYDSDHLDAELKFFGIEVIAPHRRTRKNSTQDRRRLRRYRRRWKIERLFCLVAELSSPGRPIRTACRKLSRDASPRLSFDPTQAFMR